MVSCILRAGARVIAVLLVAAAATMAPAAAAAGEATEDEEKATKERRRAQAFIIDGELADGNPQIARLTTFWSDLSASSCTGTFVSDRWVLTAAHCVVQPGVSLDDVIVESGSAFFDPIDPDYWSSLAIDVAVNPGYDPDDVVIARNDLALVQTEEASPYLTPGLPYMRASIEPSWGAPDAIGLLYGTGLIAQGVPTDFLWRAWFASGTVSQCSSVASSAGATFDPSEAICAEGFDPNGFLDPEACPGDSGGPLLTLTTDDQLAVAGSLSVGVFSDPPGPCTIESIAFFTRVSRHAVWIQTVTGVGPIAPLPLPTVDAGPARSILVGQTASLDGSTANADSVRWTKAGGPGSVAFANPTSEDTSASFTVAGTYTLRLTASNSVGSRADQTTVTVRTAPPPTPGSADGYLVLEQDGDLYAFGAARPLLRLMDPSAIDDPVRQATISSALKPHVAGHGAVALERTADRRGLWVLLADGRILTLGNAPSVPGVSPGLLTKTVAGVPERVTALTRVGSGDLWVFTSAGRIVPQIGALPPAVIAQMNVVLALELQGPIVDAKPTIDGRGALAMATDGGIFAYNAPFLGSVYDAIAEALGVPVGSVGPDRPVVGITMDPDGDGYWVVAEDGGVFTPRSRAPFRGSLPAIVSFDQLFAPVNGMVPFGNGYLLGAGDGGVFNFSNQPFSGSASGLIDTSAVGMAPV